MFFVVSRCPIDGGLEGSFQELCIKTLPVGSFWMISPYLKKWCFVNQPIKKYGGWLDPPGK